MNTSYTLMTKYLNELDINHISINDFLETFELNNKDALIEILNYLNINVKNYISGSDDAYLLLKASIIFGTILPTVEFKSSEIQNIKKKTTKVKSLIMNIKEIEPTKSRKHHISKSINILEKAHFKLDRSDEKVYDKLRKYIKNRVSIDYIQDFVKEYSGWAEEVNNGKTIYDYIIDETLNLFPIKDNSYDIYYFMKLLKVLRKKAVILNYNYLKKINKLRNSCLSRKDDILLLEISYIIEEDEYELSEADIDSKYCRKKLPNIEEEYFSNIIIPNRKQNDAKVITIDPSLLSLKDDGLSIRKDGKDYILGIHITDVASKIPENGIIDMVARQNFKTFYEGGLKLYEMIDSKFSMPYFSLEEGKHMPTISLYVRFSNDGKIKDYYFDEDEVNIYKNLTYEDADIMLKEDSELSNYLNDLLFITEILKQDNNGEEYRKIKELINNKTNEEYSYSTHSIVMESMVLYNELMAKLFYEDDEAPFIYRVHTEPTDEDLIRVIKILTNKNESISLGKARNDLITKVRELYPSAHYSINNLGHHGLGLSYYAHATSPGRRYPDLVSQRLYSELFVKTRTIEKIENYSKICEKYAKMYNLYSKLQPDYYKELTLIKKK